MKGAVPEGKPLLTGLTEQAVRGQPPGSSRGVLPESAAVAGRGDPDKQAERDSPRCAGREVS